MKKIAIIFVSAFLMIPLFSCTQQVKKMPQKKESAADLSKLSQATFASGCFWCLEGVYESVKGVHEVVSGYSGGKEPNPTYEQVGSHATGHAEAVEVYYDSSIVSYPTLLKVYFASQNPTQVNGQGPDKGAPYRSIIFYRTAEEKMQAEKSIAETQKKYTEPIAAQLTSFKKFWKAEEYHQDYIQKNPDVAYVRGESIPRIKRFQKQLPELIKPDHKL
ncbi:peptide-methionine (S)-S-oxide reductase MsrA [Daejeonella sp.]|uniref:peptide-methionine (S)-S-oxide reductase MsrA n=1 Tax=Daejeonella sp. TaxID=2805397 RepID=UPI0030C50E3E